MCIPSTIRTSFGPRVVPLHPMVRVTLTMRELHTLARSIERDAAEAEHDGNHAAATTLAWRASALREAAR